MPRPSENDQERFARIEALMEEYRLNHEDLEAYVKAARERAAAARQKSRDGLASARRRFARTKRD